MSKTLMLVIVLLVGYFVGAKFPMLARSIGV